MIFVLRVVAMHFSLRKLLTWEIVRRGRRRPRAPADPRCDAFRGLGERGGRSRFGSPLSNFPLGRDSQSLRLADAKRPGFKQINNLGRGSRRLSSNAATKEQAEIGSGPCNPGSLGHGECVPLAMKSFDSFQFSAELLTGLLRRTHGVVPYQGLETTCELYTRTLSFGDNGSKRCGNPHDSYVTKRR